MNNEIYILVGICVLAFVLGHKLKQRLSKPAPKPIKNKGKQAKSKLVISSSTSTTKEKLKIVFLYIQLALVFGLLIFMIPALSRDILSNNQVSNQNLILRIVIVVFATYILFIGYLKLRKPPRKNN
ncbi:hypothetical protein BZG02_19625 [Labilibaculum filiforme]|uniref:Uncharacterized protein n=1 Tax=Labilibaculum filiforme TaxID=1940526 RepID=A0A2N3HQI2_9BACT|nr:hypothetical protein [Labilibaculum filiforme]PKQ60324.1 hypothetical protein BZG02_19625 [Labilibaculum filiforme]